MNVNLQKTKRRSDIVSEIPITLSNHFYFRLNYLFLERFSWQLEKYPFKKLMFFGIFILMSAEVLTPFRRSIIVTKFLFIYILFLPKT